MGFFRSLIGNIFPHRCLRCGTLVGQTPGICLSCWDGFVHVAGPLCSCCGIPLPEHTSEDALCGACIHHPPLFQGAKSVFIYNEASKDLVLKLKNQDKTFLAKYVAPWMVRAGSTFWNAHPVLIPTPLHWRKQFKRQFNQSALLAHHIGQQVQLPVVHGLSRIKNSPSQGTFSTQQRAQNVKNAFHADARLLKGIKKCVLIDDVFTTGATVGACAKALKKAGVEEIYVLTLCRVVKEEPT